LKNLKIDAEHVEGIIGASSHASGATDAFISVEQ
jgi:hypothetical protein